MKIKRSMLAVAAGAALVPVLGLATPAGAARAAPANVTGHICATADTNLCIGAPGLIHNGQVFETDPAHARNFGFVGPGATSFLYFTAAPDLCLGNAGGNSRNVTIKFTTGEAGVDFTWTNAPNGGHYFINRVTGLYLSVEGGGAVVTVEAKGQFGWDQRFNGP